MRSISKLLTISVWLSASAFAFPLKASSVLCYQTSTSADSTYSTAGLFDVHTRPVQVSKQFEFTEGPAVDKKGNIFFTDQPNDAIWEYDVDGKLTQFADHTGRSNGMYFDRKGNLITCADDNNELIAFSPDKKRTILLKDFQGHRLNGPNDLWVDAKGGIYFTDPLYVRDYWKGRKPDVAGEKVYYMPAGQSQAHVVTEQLKKPNGIVGTPDGKHLFVADIGANKTYKFDIAGDGSLTNQQLFTQQGSDGMTLDNQGNVYLTGGKGVYIYNPQGIQIGLISISEPWTANVAFGGKHKDVLFITSSKAVYTMQMKVRGVE